MLKHKIPRETFSSGPAPIMDVSNFVDSVQDLSDLELATLLCLIAKEHCIFETADELIDDLASELALVCVYKPCEGFI